MIMSFFSKILSKINKPLVSVIVPNYNNSLYLSECVNSILDQTYSNMEIIICDDYSTDDSRKILSKYESYKNITIIYNKSNLGVSKTRDKAIREAKGKYITTLDSDDFYLDSKKIEKELKLVLQYKGKGKNIIAFSNVKVVHLNAEMTAYQKGKYIKEGDLLIPIITRECMIPRDFLFLKESYLEVGGFEENLNLHEDWDLKIRLASKHEFYYTSISGIAYRKTHIGLSNCTKEDRINSLKYVFNKNIDLVREEEKIFCINKIYAHIDNIK